MRNIHNEPGAPSVRASDAERDQSAEVLRAAFAEGRLTRAELDERLAAAYAAKTHADLRDLTGDLPGAVRAEATAYDRLPVMNHGPGMRLNLCLLLCLLFCFPPAGIAYAIYWIVTARRQPQPPAGEPFLSVGA
jgi:hypothetical protein